MSEEKVKPNAVEVLAEHLLKGEVEKVNEVKRSKEEIAASMERAQTRLRLEAAVTRNKQLQCTHFKGGRGAAAVVKGEGDDDRDPCVGAIRLPNGVTMVICTRCQKTAFGEGRKDKDGKAIPADKAFAKMYKLFKKSKNSQDGVTECNQLRVRVMTADEVEEYEKQVQELEDAE